MRALILFTLLFGLTSTLTARELPLWEVGVGLGAMQFPDYRGADQSQRYLLPFPAVVYRGERLKVDDKGLRGLLFDSERVIVDISLDGAVPVDSSQNGAREDMPDLDATFEVGPSLKFMLYDDDRHEVRLNLPWRLVYSTDFRQLQSHGHLLHPHLSYDRRRDWNMGLSLGPLYASHAYHDYYYSVSASDATPERPAYQADGGYSGMRYTFSMSKRFKRVWLGGFVRYDDLRGARFEDSPLLRRDNSWMGGVTAIWFFHQSSRRVSD